MQPPLRQWCLFLDVDGTLLEHADTPDAVSVPSGLRIRLGMLADALDGALALISGRTLASLDRLFAPLHLPAAGVHGLERRDSAGRLHSQVAHDVQLEPARHTLKVFSHRHPGVLLESKPGALAVHYRRAPQYREVVCEEAQRVAASLGPGFVVLAGDQVCEIKPQLPDKGSAVQAFLDEAPFANRIPIFIGDDHSDRDAMRVVKQHSGLTIAVGERLSADRQLANPNAVRRWLGGLLLHGNPLQ